LREYGISLDKSIEKITDVFKKDLNDELEKINIIAEKEEASTAVKN
jgi:hypothetical protein